MAHLSQGSKILSFTPSELLWIISGSPWVHSDDSAAPAQIVHRFAQRYGRTRHSRWRQLAMFAIFLGGMPVVLGMIAVFTGRHGRRVCEAVDKSRLQQVVEQLGLWWKRGVLPISYYAFELYRNERRRHALDYLYRHETKQCAYPLLRQRFSSAASTEALRDKARFARHCSEHSLPAVPALFTVVDENIRGLGADERLPSCDLFLKPLSGAGGRGAELWHHQDNGQYHHAEHGNRSEAQLIEHLRALSRQQPYVARLYVRNCPELAQLSSGALCTVRVLTCLDETGKPVVTDAVLRMARTPGIVVDNFHAGGIAAKVELGTGRLGPATDMGLASSTRWYDEHPTTGGPITGRVVPNWEEVLSLARRAHEIFADHIAIGWDIAVLDFGPQLVEGNKGPDLDIIQRTGGMPIGATRFGELLAHHLRRAEETAPVAAEAPSAASIHAVERTAA
ncbi:MAG TPA: sugar-transfer associated ATP-grasp domain-containing protein [Terriglobales bacterium]|nr:sugar-transfer associated ATP-grasp domain-containing protein [Terriglobales bacterium]